VPTNVDRRYANKEAIDCAYTLAGDFLRLLDSLATDDDVWRTMDMSGYGRGCGTSVRDDYEALRRLNCDLKKSFLAIEENLSFAYVALLPHYGKSKRLLRLELEDVFIRVEWWVCDGTRLGGFPDGREWAALFLNDEYPYVRRYPITNEESVELWSKYDLEYSRLLRDLASLPVSEGIEIGEAGKQAGKGAENGDGLPSAALGALIDAGLGSVLNEARKLPAVDRHSRTMMEMLAQDASKYDWTLDDWRGPLKASKKTIQATDAWKHILQWREDKKQQRPRAE
jgi:hypothetical protein